MTARASPRVSLPRARAPQTLSNALRRSRSLSRARASVRARDVQTDDRPSTRLSLARARPVPRRRHALTTERTRDERPRPNAKPYIPEMVAPRGSATSRDRRNGESSTRARCLESTTRRALRATHIATRRNEGERREAIEAPRATTMHARCSISPITTRRGPPRGDHLRHVGFRV